MKKTLVAERKALVESDLAGAIPAIEFASASVKSIKRQQLVEIRAFANPPRLVKMALECVCILLGETVLDWKSIRTIIVKEDFIPCIVNFKTETVAANVSERIRKEYFELPEVSFYVFPSFLLRLSCMPARLVALWLNGFPLK